jgi:hypothetical protein
VCVCVCVCVWAVECVCASVCQCVSLLACSLCPSLPRRQPSLAVDLDFCVGWAADVPVGPLMWPPPRPCSNVGNVNMTPLCTIWLRLLGASTRGSMLSRSPHSSSCHPTVLHIASSIRVQGRNPVTAKHNSCCAAGQINGPRGRVTRAVDPGSAKFQPTLAVATDGLRTPRCPVRPRPHHHSGRASRLDLGWTRGRGCGRHRHGAV